MKYARTILPAYIFLPLSLLAQDASTCANAIALSFDASIRNYTSSSSIGGYLLCTGSGNSPVTWFQFTTNAAAECPLLSISASDNQACEVTLFSSCSGSSIAGSGMCFYDGNGLWAPAENLLLSANKTYYLRVKTSTACNISIGSQFYTPPNNTCAGAFSIGTDFINDNNACHKPGTGFTASQLCAFSIENTAFYQFYVAATGVCVININNISCDNGANNNSNGFQIGFFTGNCSALSWLSCTSGAGSFVQATTPALNAGTKVYVAIDGNAGSNCAYSISGVNILSVLDEAISNFSAWQSGSSNILKWSKKNETNGYYEIEKSTDGNSFSVIGKRYAQTNNATVSNYSFEDASPSPKTFYRLRKTDISGQAALSNIIKIERKTESARLIIVNPATNTLHVNVVASQNEQMNGSIINAQGLTVSNQFLTCSKGNNPFEIDISSLPVGRYFFVLRKKDAVCQASFLKIN